MASDQMRSDPLAIAGSGKEDGIMASSGEPHREVGGCKGLQRNVLKSMGFVLPEETSGNAPQDGSPGLQRTMSKDMGGRAQQTNPGGGGLQRTMSRDFGGPQPGGLQRTMSRDLGAGSQPGGLQRTMSRDMGNAAVPRDASRQPRKTSGKGERIPRSAGSQDPLPRHNTPSS